MYPAVFEDEVVVRAVPGARLAVAGDRVPVPVEDVALDPHVSAVGGLDTVARRMGVATGEADAGVTAGMLIVVDVVVVYPHLTAVVDHTHKGGVVAVIAVLHTHR